MEYARFESKLHEKIVFGWLSARGLVQDFCDDLPAMGYVSFDGELPVAAAFLRRCEGGLGILEGLVTNPTASSEQRHAGIDLVVKRVLAAARKYRMRRILAYSLDEGTLVRSKTHGFMKLPQTLIGLDLGEYKDGISRGTIRDQE